MSVSDMKGQLVVLVGPSAVGKSTVVKEILAKRPDIYFSISATTRAPRVGEIEGKDYFFITEQVFREMIAEDKFLEWAEIYGGLQLSGTPKDKVMFELNSGRDVLIEVDVVGAKNIKRVLPEAKTVFLLPPSLEELERRLRSRGTESAAVIERRLDTALTEIAQKDFFDVQLVNENIDAVVSAILKLYN